MNLGKLRETEYVKCVGLLADLIDLDADTRDRIHKRMQSIEIKNFFLHLESADLSPEATEKLESLKSILEIFDEEGGQA